MPDTPITPIIGEITEMQAAFKQPSCNSKQPMVQYPSVGTPPVLSFNVPQNTAFTTYGYFMKYFPPGYLLPFTKKIPTNNYFNTVRNMNAQQAIELFDPGPQPTGTMTNYLTGKTIFTVAPLAPISDSKPTPTSVNPTMAAIGVSGSKSPALDESHFGSTAVEWKPKPTLKATYAANNLRPVDVMRLNGLGPITNYIAEPPQPTPRIIIIEEYTTESFLGNYGAGKIVKTFSLYPGERTTISVRTYKDKVSTVEQSKNVLDSFSDSSATALDTLMQQEQGNLESTSRTSAGGGSSFTTSTDSRNSTKSSGISGNLNILKFLSIGGGYGKSMSEASTTSGGMSSTYDYAQTASRMSNMNVLSSSLNKHVQQSNAVRQIDVNTSTSDVSRSGEEDVTVRELKNVNLNNTLNITYRQLLQEYTVITYLSNIKFAYTNGYPESYTVVDLCDLPNMLLDILDTTANPGVVNTVLCKLLTPYCNVMDYESNLQTFVEKFTITGGDCLNLGCQPGNEDLYRIPPDFKMLYSDGVVNKEIRGVILKVQKQTLQTSSLIADALLGRGDALDCFNQNAQNASNIADYVNSMQAMQRLTANVQATANDQLFADQQLDMGTKQIDLVDKKMAVMDQQMDVVTGITDPLEKATHYKKVFGDCCDVPQSCCGGGCGCSCAETTEEPPTS